MPADPVLLADVRSWLIKAANDLRGADVDLAAAPPLLEDARFHCQQLVEKSFKAFLTYRLPVRPEDLDWFQEQVAHHTGTDGVSPHQKGRG